jgi:hypothetical protein
MNRASQIASHLGALTVGIAIAAVAGGVPAGKSNPVSESGRPERGVVVANGGRTSGSVPPIKKTRAGLKAADFKMAWDAVASRELSREERRKLQSQILEKWAEVDLEGAMHAAISQAWDEDGNDPFAENFFLAAFSKAFADRPLDAWALIQSGKYGLGTQMLREKWLAAVSSKDRELVLSMLSEIPVNMQPGAVEQCFGSLIASPDRDALLAKLIKQAGGGHDDWLEAVFKAVPADGDPAALRKDWSGLPEGVDRKIALLKWGASLRGADANSVSAELAAIPAGSKDEAAKALISQLEDGCMGMLAALDFALATDSWGSLSKASAPILESFAQTDLMDAGKIAEWGAHLPERPDTAKLYQAAVGRYIGKDLGRAKEWLGGMAEGSWQRENALAEFSRQALQGHQDQEASQWALDSISDVRVKAEAAKLRQTWDQDMADLARTNAQQ